MGLLAVGRRVLIDEENFIIQMTRDLLLGVRQLRMCLRVTPPTVRLPKTLLLVFANQIDLAV